MAHLTRSRLRRLSLILMLVLGVAMIAPATSLANPITIEKTQVCVTAGNSPSTDASGTETNLATNIPIVSTSTTGPNTATASAARTTTASAGNNACPDKIQAQTFDKQLEQRVEQAADTSNRADVTAIAPLTSDGALTSLVDASVRNDIGRIGRQESQAASLASSGDANAVNLNSIVVETNAISNTPFFFPGGGGTASNGVVVQFEPISVASAQSGDARSGEATAGNIGPTQLGVSRPDVHQADSRTQHVEQSLKTGQIAKTDQANSLRERSTLDQTDP
jgi:hypothetical protein